MAGYYASADVGQPSSSKRVGLPVSDAAVPVSRYAGKEPGSILLAEHPHWAIDSTGRNISAFEGAESDEP
jgi:hypothetical protein